MHGFKHGLGLTCKQGKTEQFQLFQFVLKSKNLVLLNDSKNRQNVIQMVLK